MQYADVIIDISAAELDRTFQYEIPAEMVGQISVGAPVQVPFGRGNTSKKGYVVGISDVPKISPERIKPLLFCCERGLAIEDSMVELAYWMKEYYGGTLNDALHTVIPVKVAVETKPRREIVAEADKSELTAAYADAVKKHHSAKARLLLQLRGQAEIPYEVVSGKMHCSASTIHSLQKAGYLSVRERTAGFRPGEGHHTVLNAEQEAASQQIIDALGTGQTFLLFGITGSGKTEVYLRTIEKVLKRGEQAIVLIPEISLTYQTVMRFYRCFGDRVAFMHSKLSKGERYQISEKARRGEISIMIGPRSALFTPFPKLGLIVVDEEHENSYKSEGVPRYHARETAVKRGQMSNAVVVLGSATPSMESYTRAEAGEYRMLTLTRRAGSAVLPEATIVDMRKEFANRNRSMFSRCLKEKMTKRLERNEQIMLFLNRRGYAGFVSCRSCGEAVRCPHCDVSLTYHRDGSLRCHYCGFQSVFQKKCPGCGSAYIGPFGTGTEKVEELVHQEFPGARVLRMDADTTRGKDGYEEILNAFADRKADILIGTQMIVKGHDFGGVTLVGVLAADMSLLESDYRSAERTFQLLSQAAGRAGRADKPGEVVIQTYQPMHYAVQAAARQDMPAFFREEIAFRRLMNYPPVGNLLVVFGTGPDEERLHGELKKLLEDSKEFVAKRTQAGDFSEIFRDGNPINEGNSELPVFLGPGAAGIRKAQDLFRQVIYVKSPDYQQLIAVKNRMEQLILAGEAARGCRIQFDFNPMNFY